MTGREFIRKIQRYTRQRSVTCRIDKKRGKGSHVTLYFADHRTVFRNPREELKTGTLHAMLNQLGLQFDDIQDN